MPLYRDYYDIALSVNNQPVDLIPNAFSFSMTDSIHKLFSFGKFYLNDEAGLLQEYFGTDIGTKVGLQLGTEDFSNSNNYIITDSELPEVSTSKYLSGTVDITLKHEWFNYQYQSSEAYNNRISAVIQTLIGNYPFYDTQINDTQNGEYWYKGNRTQSEFIKEVLLPRAYSSNSAGTPYFAFTTNNNEFHFRHLSDMYNKQSKGRYRYDPTRTKPGEDVNPLYTVYNISKWNTPMDGKTKKQRNVQKYLLRNDGILEDKGVETLPEHIKTVGTIPIMNDRGLINDVYTYYFDSQLNDQGKGQINNLFRESVFTDQFLLTVPFNPELKSGDKIELEILKQEEGGDGLSERYTGNYIIEMCTHKWIKERSVGETDLIVGRGSAVFPSNYLFSQQGIKV